MNCVVRIVGVLAVLFSLNSCMVYYYSVLDSENASLIKNVDNDFVDENDSVLVAYCFYGENAPVKITIMNKTDEPLYVDWASSALIIDDVAMSYKESSSTAHFVAESVQSGVSLSSGGWTSGYSTSSGVGQALVAVPQGSQFIPPHSKIEYTSLRLGNFTFDEIPKKQFSKQPFVTKYGEHRNVHVKKYNEVVSPVRFRSYLTLYKKEQQGEKVRSFVKEHAFYVAEVIRAGGISPENFLAGANRQGDFFYVTRERGTGFAVAGVIALSIVGAVVADEATIYY